jgi:hypothetical protein
VLLNFAKVKPTFDGIGYLLTFVLPNFYFIWRLRAPSCAARA